MGLTVKENEKYVESLIKEERDLLRRLGEAQPHQRGYQSKGVANPYLDGLPDKIKKEINEVKEKARNVSNETNDIRFKMAQSETELLIVFRELMSWDMFVPENYFDGDRLLKQDQWASSDQNQEFLIPTKTFWLPVVLDDDIIDPDSAEAQNPNYMMRVPGNHNNPQNRGFTLPDPLKENLKDFVSTKQESFSRMTDSQKGSKPTRRSSRSDSTSRKMPVDPNEFYQPMLRKP